MAQRVDIHLVDDIDGGEASETVTFGLDGGTYEIDLSAKNAEKMRKALAVYVASARKVNRALGTRARLKAPTGPAAAHVRAWATENGYEVPERGRIPAEVREAYIAAN